MHFKNYLIAIRHCEPFRVKQSKIYFYFFRKK